jgi:hypothetical protein
MNNALAALTRRHSERSEESILATMQVPRYVRNDGI